MKEPLKEVPNELIEELNAYDSENLAHHPVAEALRDLIEDWKRLKEASIDDDDYAVVLNDRDEFCCKLERIRDILKSHKEEYLDNDGVFSASLMLDDIQGVLDEQTNSPS